MKFDYLINSMASGELGRHMHGRTNHEKYASGCKRLENFIVRPHGGIYRRPGLRFIHESMDNDPRQRILGFDFNATTSQAYILELGNEKMRFYKDGGIIVDGGSPYEIATPWTLEQLWDLQYVQLADLIYFAHPNVAPQILTRTDHTAWTLTPMDFRIPGHDVLVVDTDSSTTTLGHEGDTFTIPDGMVWHDAMVVKGKNPGGEDRWFLYTGLGHFRANGSDLTITFKDEPDHDANEVESIYKSNKLEADWIVQTTADSAPEVWGGTNWPAVIGLFDDRMILARTPGQPRTMWMSRVGHHFDFQMNTSSDGEPLADDAIKKDITGSLVTPIQWVEDQDELITATSTAAGKTWGGVEGEAITPGNCKWSRQSTNGSAGRQGRLIGQAIVYMGRSRRKVHEMMFNIQTYKYQAPDLTLLHPEVTGTGLRDFDALQDPTPMILAARDDGMLVASTYMQEENVNAWHRHPLGGDGKALSVACIPGEHSTEGWVLVQRTVGGASKVYMERMDESFESKMLRINPEFTDAREAFFVDSGISHDAPIGISAVSAANPVQVTASGHGLENGATVQLEGVQAELDERRFTVANRTEDTFELAGEDGTGLGAYAGGGTARECKSALTGFDHLEGEAVDVLADGSVVSGITVSGGGITLPKAAARVHAGLGYRSVYVPLRPEVQLQTGTLQGKRKRIMGATVRWEHTVGGRIGTGDNPPAERMEAIPTRSAVIGGGAPQIFREDHKVSLSGDSNTDGYFTVVQDAPLPMAATCFMVEVAIG